MHALYKITIPHHRLCSHRRHLYFKSDRFSPFINPASSTSSSMCWEKSLFRLQVRKKIMTSECSWTLVQFSFTVGLIAPCIFLHDADARCIFLERSPLFRAWKKRERINNLKTFAQALWGEGIQHLVMTYACNNEICPQMWQKEWLLISSLDFWHSTPHRGLFFHITQLEIFK